MNSHQHGGQRLLVPKAKDFSNEKNYHPITRLNNSYNIMTGKYMRHQTNGNNIWDKGQLEVKKMC